MAGWVKTFWEPLTGVVVAIPRKFKQALTRFVKISQECFRGSL
jgi:hypothetical protein